MKKSLFFLIFFLLNNVFASSLEDCRRWGLDNCKTHSRPLNNCQDQVFQGIFPKPTKDSSKTELICHSGYLISANHITKTSDWVAYRLRGTHTQRDLLRNNYFCPDPCLIAGNRAELEDYSGLYPIFNRGHMTPAVDHKWNDTHYKESFFLSNIVPQNPENNSGIWLRLEQLTSTWAQLRGELYIFTGPVQDYKFLKHIVLKNPHQVWAPAALFKIVYDPKKNQVASFIIPNSNIDPDELFDFAVSVETVNEITGYDFLPGLDKQTRNSIPTKTLWPIR